MPGTWRRRGAPRLRAGLALAALGLVGLVAWWQPLASAGARFLDAWIAAQQAMLAATGNVNADGRAEFAVLLADGTTPHALRQALAGMSRVSFLREADLGGWIVVEADAGDRAGIDAVRALPGVRLVMPNRGLWICH